MFKATACPGPYLESKMPEIASKVNAILHPPITKLTAQQLAENINKNPNDNNLKIYFLKLIIFTHS